MFNLKPKIQKSALYLIEKLGYLISPLILNFTDEKNQLLVFYFHGFYESEAQKKLNHVAPQNNLTVNQFVDFIDYFLNNNYHFVNQENLLEGFQNHKPQIMLTFDDGYFNNTFVLDVLNKYKIPATIFVTVKNVLENKSFWWDIIYKYRTKEGFSLEKIRKEFVYLKSLKYPYIESYIEQNFGTKANEPWSDIDRPFNPKELKEISENPYVIIGNHTYNHAILTHYNRQEIKEEFILSNKALFEITGIIPKFTAFPNGNFNDIVLKVAEEVGFRFAFSVENKLNSLPIISNNNFNCLNRFMGMPKDIKKYASLNRLGYTPGTLYFNVKKRFI